jgi:hypothetical protein
MPAQQENNLNQLFHLTLDWYAKRPDQLIPLDMWDAMTERFSQGYEKVIQIGNRKIAGISLNLIPALAAINFKVSSPSLMMILKHHQVHSHDILDTRFIRPPQGKVEDMPGKNQSFILDHFSVIKEIIDATCLDEGLSNNMAEAFHNYEDNYGIDYDFEVACLLSTNQNLWPVTHLNRYLKNLEAGKPALKPRLTPVYCFKDEEIDFSQFTKNQIIMMLERSGNLHSGVISENGFGDKYDAIFFNEFFAELHAFYAKGMSHVVNAINTLEDTEIINRIADAIIRSVPDFGNKQEGRGSKILNNMETFLNRNLYQKVLNSVVIKLNVLELKNLPPMLSKRVVYSETSPLNEFKDAGDQLFRRLYDELGHLESSEFLRPHFRAIGALLDDWKVPQDLTGIDLHGFLIRTLNALDTYSEAKHYDEDVQETEEFATFASRQVERLSVFVSQNQSPDYKRLASLSSPSKALLATHGFDIKKLPGINRKDKGQMLSDELGL